MSSNDFSPAITSLDMSTSMTTQELVLFLEEENILYVACCLGGLSRRTLPIVHEVPDYLGVYLTLFHQFGGKETTVVRRYLVEYPPDTIDDTDLIELEIPIDDDFRGIDFVSNFYFLHVSFTGKQPGEMGISESIYYGRVLETKIPFILKDKRGKTSE